MNEFITIDIFLRRKETVIWINLEIGIDTTLIQLLIDIYDRPTLIFIQNLIDQSPICYTYEYVYYIT